MRGNISLPAVIVISTIICFTACKSTKSTPNRGAERTAAKRQKAPDSIVKSDDVAGLQNDLTGTFQNNVIADSATVVQQLRMYPIWQTKEDKYVYVERSEKENPNQLSDQQVYKLESDGSGGFVVRVHALESPQLFKGKGIMPSFFDQYDTDILTESEGCSLYLIKHADGSYSGSTRLDHCKNSKNGSAYITTTVKVKEDSMMFWEKGYDAAGKQLWEESLAKSRFSRVAEQR